MIQYEAICELLWQNYPVEAFYPVLRAVAMLGTEIPSKDGATVVFDAQKERTIQEKLLKKIVSIERIMGENFYKHPYLTGYVLNYWPHHKRVPIGSPLHAES